MDDASIGLDTSVFSEAELEQRLIQEITIQLNELDLEVYKSNTRNED